MGINILKTINIIPNQKEFSFQELKETLNPIISSDLIMMKVKRDLMQVKQSSF